MAFLCCTKCWDEILGAVAGKRGFSVRGGRSYLKIRATSSKEKSNRREYVDFSPFLLWVWRIQALSLPRFRTLSSTAPCVAELRYIWRAWPHRSPSTASWSQKPRTLRSSWGIVRFGWSSGIWRRRDETCFPFFVSSYRICVWQGGNRVLTSLPLPLYRTWKLLTEPTVKAHSPSTLPKKATHTPWWTLCCYSVFQSPIAGSPELDYAVRH